MFTVFNFPWRIEGKATPFSPWSYIDVAKSIESASRLASALRNSRRYYATRVVAR